MEYLYIKAAHIIFVVSWFAGLFYIVRLFIYHTEALDKTNPEKDILHEQFSIMEKRLMNIISTPAMVLTVGTGVAMIILVPDLINQGWMHVKLTFVAGLVVYHFVCLNIMRKLIAGKKSMSSTQLRLWNELATLFLIAIVYLVVVRSLLDTLWGALILFGIGVTLFVAVKLYKKYRKD